MALYQVLSQHVLSQHVTSGFKINFLIINVHINITTLYIVQKKQDYDLDNAGKHQLMSRLGSSSGIPA